MSFYVHESQMDEDSEYYEQKIINLRAAERSFENGDLLSSKYPPRLNILSNYSCNGKCAICPVERPMRKDKTMDLEVFNRIAKEAFPAAIVISTTTIGEPLLLPWFGHLCKTLDDYSVMADIVTNATLFTEEKIDSMLKIAADIKISYDGSKKETFESIRCGCSKTAVDNGLDRLIKRRKILRPKQNPTVTIQMTLLKKNIEELPDVIRYACNVGADRVKAYYLISYSEALNNEVLAGDDLDSVCFIEEAKDIAKSCKIELEVAERSASPENAPLERVKCPTAWSQMWIDHDGAVRTCHSHNGYEIGNANDGIAKLWNGAGYQHIRKASVEDIRDTPCWRCGMLYRQKGNDSLAPYDKNNFLCNPAAKENDNEIKWSNRTRLFHTERYT